MLENIEEGDCIPNEDGILLKNIGSQFGTLRSYAVVLQLQAQSEWDTDKVLREQRTTAAPGYILHAVQHSILDSKHDCVVCGIQSVTVTDYLARKYDCENVPSNL